MSEQKQVNGFRKTKAKTKAQVTKENQNLSNAIAARLMSLESNQMGMFSNVFTGMKQLKEEQIALVDLVRFTDSTEASANGDKIMLDFCGRFKNEDGTAGKRFQGGTNIGYTFELGAGRIIPSLEDQLVGLKAGDVRSLTVKFPEDYQAAELKGKEVLFDIEVVKVFKRNYKGAILALIEELELQEANAKKEEVSTQETTQESNA